MLSLTESRGRRGEDEPFSKGAESNVTSDGVACRVVRLGKRVIEEKGRLELVGDVQKSPKRFE